jgi:hypothetical protein
MKDVVGWSWGTKQIAIWGSAWARRNTSIKSTQIPTEVKMVTAYEVIRPSLIGSQNQNQNQFRLTRLSRFDFGFDILPALSRAK